MSSNDPALKRYIRSIGCEIPFGKMRKRIISQIRDSIFAYIQENPQADFETLQCHFGTPKEITASYLYAQDTSALLRKVNINKKVLTIVAGVMTAILLIWIGTAVWDIVDVRSTNRGQIVVSSGMIDP